VKSPVDQFRERGCLTARRVFKPEFIDDLGQEYFRQFADLENAPPDAKLKVGERRIQVAPRLKGPFLAPDLYGHPFVLNLIQALLGEDFLIDSLSIVNALPGAAVQHLHKDHSDLFPDQPLARALVPAYAVTVVIPLLDLTPSTGTTKFYVGSHRSARNEDSVETPFVSKGDCFLMDYRIWHQGTENQSDSERPLIYIVYSRPWFTDIINYGDRPRIDIDPADLSTVPEEHRFLFRRLAARGSFDRAQNELFGGNLPEHRR
jgi:hypothetical protein